MINWPILLTVRDKVDTNHFSPDLPHTLPRGEVQPAKFSGAFLYLITCLELAVHILPLGGPVLARPLMPSRRNIILGPGSPELASVLLAPSAGSVPASIFTALVAVTSPQLLFIMSSAMLWT